METMTQSRGVKEDDPRLIFMTIEEACKSPTTTGTYFHYIDHWWIVHPTKGLAFWSPGRKANCYDKPQCNSNKEVATRIAHALYRWAEVRQIRTVTVKSGN